MTNNEINQMYIERFIDSMQNDFDQWKVNHLAGPGMAWTEYHSPDYENENGRVCFGFSLNSTGAWIDGFFRWSVPFMNPLGINYRRFRKAKRKMIKHIKTKEKNAYNSMLRSKLGC